ncbi:GTP cyclohydrolase FolE2 [Thioalkalivibrio sp. ALgr3]|uniref:GTP cyclohydrolase FolE2 n=1 Tax=Thioalkalivibrio sp. ALgr3 TaxID=1239292 RepID=UPI00035FD32B|nr:GTP cyclohydrolase FolE2 [Thioalkalivibrio sp. ALgr3]
MDAYSEHRSTDLPDVATGTSRRASSLDWVGMERIALPLQVAGQPVAARADAGVSLDDPKARGIHMSRLYLALRMLIHRELDCARLDHVLDAFLESHEDLSGRAALSLEGEALLERPAMVSPLAGWKAYPFRVDTEKDDRGTQIRLGIEIGYSSTCPCSAALARQAIQERYDQDFGTAPPDPDRLREWLGSEAGIMATPHSQRSRAWVEVGLRPDAETFPFRFLVDRVEQALGTALQTAVKRADEQAFAVANGANPMFCEDAARRLDEALEAPFGARGYRIHVRHEESLHAHDAVARVERPPRGA